MTRYLRIIGDYLVLGMLAVIAGGVIGIVVAKVLILATGGFR